MNILWLSQVVPYPPKGGVLQRSYNLLRELAKYHTIYLLAFIQKDLLAAHFPSVEQGEAEAFEALSSFCAKIKFIPIPCDQTPRGKHYLALKSLFTRNPYTVNWLESKEAARILNDWRAKFRFDVVHFDTISLAPYSRLFENTPMIMGHHNIESHMMLRRAKNEHNWLTKMYFFQEGIRLQAYEKKHCRDFKVNVTCSDLDSKRLNQLDPLLRAVEIPNGVDLEYFKSGNVSQKPNSLVFAGTLNWYPNQQAVLYFARELWPRLKTEIPDVSMDLIGASPPETIVELAKQDSAFRVHGFVDDIRPYLDRAAVYVCPISDGGGTKLKILDAFAMQKAVVANPIACEGIAVAPERNVLFAMTPEEYIHKIKFLMANEKKRLELGTNARKLVEEKYSFVSIGKALSGIYETCVKPPLPGKQ